MALDECPPSPSEAALDSIARLWGMHMRYRASLSPGEAACLAARMEADPAFAASVLEISQTLSDALTSCVVEDDMSFLSRSQALATEFRDRDAAMSTMAASILNLCAGAEFDRLDSGAQARSRALARVESLLAVSSGFISMPTPPSTRRPPATSKELHADASAPILNKRQVKQAARMWRDEPRRNGFLGSRRYDVIIDGKPYPPKAIVAYANEIAGNGVLLPKDFAGAREGKWHKELSRLGFEVRSKAESAAESDDGILSFQDDERFPPPHAA